MKIGILTFHFSDNYGALLQAYALRTYLLSLGHQVEFINYHPDYVEAGGRFKFPTTFTQIKENIKIGYLKITHFQKKLFGSKSVAVAMEDFRRCKLGVTGRAFKQIHDLDSYRPSVDLLICGSDQIWNPSDQFGVDPVYFLGFPSTAKRKISYAASFGSSKPEIRYHSEIKKHLANLDEISVRENQALSFIRDISGRSAHCVPDPTFLLNDYSELIINDSTVSNNHIFAYILRSGFGFRKLSAMIQSQLKLPILSAYNPHRRWRSIGKIFYGGVEVWLSNLRSSKFVITNSFHATVFSILFNKPFIATSLPGAKAKLSGRLENLLKLTNLSNRIISVDDIDGALNLLHKPIDWDEVNNAISSLRGAGRSFLDTEINKLFKK